MADNAAQATQAAELPAAEGDDGFTAEERAQFAEMEKVTSDPSPEPPPTPEPAPVVDAAAPAADDTGDDDDDTEDGEAAPADGAVVAGKAGEPGAAQAPGEKKKKRVSFGKYQNAETRRVAAEKEAAALRENQARLDERLRIINEALTAPPAAAKTAEEEDPEPDAEKDIFEWVKWSQRERARMADQLAEMRNGRQAETQDTQLANSYIDDARSFSSQEPNFVPAYNFLMEIRKHQIALYKPIYKDLRQPGVELTRDEYNHIQKVISSEEKQLVADAISRKISPAQVIYSMARASGFSPAAAAAPAAAADAGAAPAAQNGGAAPTNGAAKPAAAAPGALTAPAATAPRVEDEIARIKAGSEAARSLSSGGGAPPNPLTPEKLANMPQDEFDALVETLSPSQTRELFGT